MLYSCKSLFQRIKTQVAEEVAGFKEKPHVLVVTTGYDEPSERYVRNKVKDFADVGIECTVFNAKTREELLGAIVENGAWADGIIVQRPILIPGWDTKQANKEVALVMPSHADIDGIKRDSSFMPPSVRGLDILLKEWDYDPAGKTAVIIGRGDVGKPVSEYLMRRDATVTVVHSKTPQAHLYDLLSSSQIIVGAAGLTSPVWTNSWTPERAIIDYGITKGENGELHGDVSEVHAYRCKYQTPVPGGMGLMVRAGLLMNIVDAYRKWRTA